MASSKIGYKPLFPDYDNLITTLSGNGTTWTATENCAVAFVAYGTNAAYGSANVNGHEVMSSYNPSSAYTSQRGWFYVKVGDIISISVVGGAVCALYVYGLK